MKAYVLFSAAALATVLLATQVAAQSAQDPQPPTQTTTPSGPVQPNQKRELREVRDEQRTSEIQQTVEGRAADSVAATPGASSGTELAPASSDPMTSAPSAAATQVASATAEPAVVTNGPVLDTAENRAKYPPMSRAGKRTAARGN